MSTKCDIDSATDSFQKDRFLPFPADNVATELSLSKFGNKIIAPAIAASNKYI